MEAEVGAGSFVNDFGPNPNIAELLERSSWTGDPKTVSSKDSAPKMVFAKGIVNYWALDLENNIPS